ncbi:MAG TPA: Gfo/Idh/MocA family oxidoreductase [Tepidisphaeraceae bacterium]|jgi:predicted dehydrogenase|nr:Gfo/Idh/MocA family oxidoreductase [Tepidisphaeraceae bacterium]
MSKQWKCAVVGAGTVGRSHVRLIPQLPAVAKLAAVCDHVPTRAEGELDRNHLEGVPVYEDIAQMLKERPEIEVIHLATPSGEHLDSALIAIEAGKHVICEKPLEINLDRVDQMINAAKNKGTRIACIFQGRWKDENRAIKQAAVDGRFGKISWAGSFTPWYRPDKYYEEVNWRGTWKLDGGGAVMNQGIHAIDLLQWIVGPVKSVSAYGGNRIHAKIETEDTMSAALEFENGAFGSIVCSTAMFPGMPTRVEIGGQNGTAVSENGLKVFSFHDRKPSDHELVEKLGPQAKPAPTPFSGAQANPAAISGDLHGRNISAILSAWANGQEAETNGPESRKPVAIVVAMYESARNGGAAVKVSQV